MAAGFALDNPGINGLASTPGMLAVRMQAAQRIAATARNDAPVATGAYKRGIRAATIGGSVYVVASDWKSWFIERGTSRLPARHILENAVARSRT